MFGKVGNLCTLIWISDLLHAVLGEDGGREHHPTLLLLCHHSLICSAKKKLQNILYWFLLLYFYLLFKFFKIVLCFASSLLLWRRWDLTLFPFPTIPLLFRIHCEKGKRLSRPPAGMLLTKLSLAQKIANLFFTVYCLFWVSRWNGF